jgi:hypothetical protein
MGLSPAPVKPAATDHDGTQRQHQPRLSAPRVGVKIRLRGVDMDLPILDGEQVFRGAMHHPSVQIDSVEQRHPIVFRRRAFF